MLECSRCFGAIGRRTLWQVEAAAADGPLGSPFAVAKARAVVAGEFAPGFALRLAYNDVALALDAAREHHLELPLTQALVPRWQQSIADGHADEDLAALTAVSTDRTPSSP